MRTDRELLELAAKAAGIELKWATIVNGPQAGEVFCSNWHPLVDDSDALRLSVNLGIGMVHHQGWLQVMHPSFADLIDVMHLGNAQKATRRAIVIAAAEIGAAMP